MPIRKPGPKLKTGPKSIFSATYYEQIQNYCLLGASTAQLSEFLCTSQSKISEWMRNDPAFAQAVKNGREDADARVAKSLFNRAVGCSVKDTHVAVIEGRVVLTEVTKNYPPDTAAAFFWLKNRVPDKWREKVPDAMALTPEEVALEAQRVIAAAMATTATLAPAPAADTAQQK